MASPQMANLLNKTAAAAEEFKRLLGAEQGWAEERSAIQQDLASVHLEQVAQRVLAWCRRERGCESAGVAARGEQGSAVGVARGDRE